MSEATGDAVALPNEALPNEALPTPTPVESTPDSSLPARAMNGQLLPGQSGNPKGRPISAHAKAAQAVQQKLDDNAEALSEKLIALALQGNLMAIKLCVERLAPRRRTHSIDLALPALKTAEDVRVAQDSVTAAIASGEIEHDQVKSLTMMLELKRESLHKEQIEHYAKTVSARWLSAENQADGSA